MQWVSQVGIVAAGSAVGGVTRWLVSIVAARLLGTAFPWGTLLVNLTGSLLLGWCLGHLGGRPAWGFAGLHGEQLRLAVAVGFTGAYTTFSSFGWETNWLLHKGDHALAGVYAVGSLLLGLAAVRCGVLLGAR